MDEKNKKLLISLLNSIFQGDPVVEDLEICNPEMPKRFDDTRGIHLDIKARLADKTMVDIEIQCRNTGEIPERFIQYLANMLVENFQHGNNYLTPKVISIWILGMNITQRKSVINQAYMTFQPNAHDRDFAIMTRKVRTIFVELPKYNIVEDPKKRNLLDAWLSFFKDPMTAVQSSFEDLQEAVSLLQLISADPKERQIYSAIEKTVNDVISEREIARDEGRIEGIREGEVKGRAEGEAIGIAKGEAKLVRAMLANGLSADQISQMTGLSIDEVKALKA